MSILGEKWGDRAILQVPEAAEILGMSAWSYYAAIKEGRVPGVRIGRRRVVVPRVALEQLLAGAALQPSTETAS
jgi:excisionase family DNA binding protein